MKCLLISGKVDEKATQLHAIASLKVLLDTTKQDLKDGKLQVSRFNWYQKTSLMNCRTMLTACRYDVRAYIHDIWLYFGTALFLDGCDQSADLM